MLYAFGDSFTDSGAGYVDTNGPTAVVYLAQSLGIPFTHANDPARGASGLNFAVAGAKTGAGEGFEIACKARGIPSTRVGRGICTQAEDFASRVVRREIAFFPEATLFFVAGGLNDHVYPCGTSKTNLVRVLSTLIAAGGRHFMLALLPTKIPLFSEVATRVNSIIREVADAPEVKGANVRISRWGERFDEILEAAPKYGFTNWTSPCAGRALFDEDDSLLGEPRQYYYFHSGHPSTAVHQIVSGRLLREAWELAGELEQGELE